MKHVKNINEAYHRKNFEKTFKSDEICLIIFDMLKELVKGNYMSVYSDIYDSYDIFNQMFNSMDNTRDFISKMRTAAESKDFKAMYDPLNKIVNKLIDANFKK